MIDISVVLQLNYADILKKVEPLRNELRGLENQAKENRLKGDEVNKLITELERSIAKYKEEYAVLISQAQAIKSSLSTVQAKVSIRGQGQSDIQRSRSVSEVKVSVRG